MTSTPTRTIRLIVAVAALTLVAACGSSSGSSKATTTTAAASATTAAAGGGATSSSGAVTIKGFGFNPSPLKVKVGTKVTWTNRDPATHTSTSDTGVWNTKSIKTGSSASFTFTKAGTYKYHCDIHPTMTAEVDVT